MEDHVFIPQGSSSKLLLWRLKKRCFLFVTWSTIYIPDFFCWTYFLQEHEVFASNCRKVELIHLPWAINTDGPGSHAFAIIDQFEEYRQLHIL